VRYISLIKRKAYMNKICMSMNYKFTILNGTITYYFQFPSPYDEKFEKKSFSTDTAYVYFFILHFPISLLLLSTE